MGRKFLGHRAVGQQSLSGRICQESRVAYPPALQSHVHGCAEDTESVGYAAPEVDRRSLFEILSRTGDLADTEVQVKRLRHHLIIKDKVVRTTQQRQALKQSAAPGPVAGVILRHFFLDEHVFDKSKTAIGDVLVERHAAFERAAA